MKKVIIISCAIGLAGSCSAMANQIHIIVKNNFHDTNSSVEVSKLTELQDMKVDSDTLTDSKLFPSTVGKSAGEMVLSSSTATDLNKTLIIKTSQGDCNVDFAYKNGKFSYVSQSGVACDYATTILKTTKVGYFLILEFSGNQQY